HDWKKQQQGQALGQTPVRDAGLARLGVIQVTHGFDAHCRHIRLAKASRAHFGIAIGLANREKAQARDAAFRTSRTV
ncbi:MAG: hypothetical protein VX598_00805, partial [Verrucomicrobiota bacterium]|nr:hypothetical protein [Verrucomicrobiota bacterium]